MISHSPRFFLQTRDGAKRPATWRGRRYWVVSRSLCAFRWFRLPNAGRTGLKDFAALRVKEWAPYADAGFHLHLTQEAVGIWAWDGGRVRDAMVAAGVQPRRSTALPETALQARGADGLHLIDCIEGVEGQLWSDGELKASRWWPESPSHEQWLDFQRAGGVVVDAALDPPSSEEPVWRGRPWTNSGQGLSFGLERRGREMVLAGAGVLLAAYGYFGGSLAHDALTLSDVEQRLRSAESQAAPAVDDRERALANLDFLAKFAKLAPYPPQLALLAKVAEKLPANGARIIAWAYQQGDLEFTVFSPGPVDILFYVKTYSSVDGFTDVAASNGEGERTLRIKLRVAKS
jgi:hypothetical protein